MVELGLTAGAERWQKPLSHADMTFDEHVVMTRRDLCLPPERDGDVAEVLRKHPPPASREVVTLWWDN
jgi:hypothetical protein